MGKVPGSGTQAYQRLSEARSPPPVPTGLSQARALPWGVAGFLEGREELMQREVLKGAGRQDIGRSLESTV